MQAVMKALREVSTWSKLNATKEGASSLGIHARAWLRDTRGESTSPQNRGGEIEERITRQRRKPAHRLQLVVVS